MILLNWLALIGAIYSWKASFFALNRFFFLANEEAFKEINQIAGKKKTGFATFYKLAQLNQQNIVLRFQNGCNKVEIELRVLQFCDFKWNLATHWFDFEIQMILDKISLHPVQLPLYSRRKL